MKKVTVKNLDGTEEAYYPESEGITYIGYSLWFEDGRQIIIHPNSVYSITIEDLNHENVVKPGTVIQI